MKHTRMTSLTSFLRRCYLLSLLRPMLPSVGGFAISSDCAFSCEIFFVLSEPLLYFKQSSKTAVSSKNDWAKYL